MGQGDGALIAKRARRASVQGREGGGRNGRLVTHRGTDHGSVNTRDDGNRYLTVGKRSYRYTVGKNQAGLYGTGANTVKSRFSTQRHEHAAVCTHASPYTHTCAHPIHRAGPGGVSTPDTHILVPKYLKG